LREATDRLASVGADLIGVVVNGATARRGHSYYGAYGRYGRGAADGAGPAERDGAGNGTKPPPPTTSSLPPPPVLRHPAPAESSSSSSGSSG
jgi:hypothetical protein